MAIAHEFEYEKPASVGEAVRILERHGGDAHVLAGGTDLVGWMRDELVAPAVLVDIKGIDGLAGIEVRGDELFLGALVTFSDVIASGDVVDRAPLMFEMARSVASTGIRNRATVVGNICSAVPSCDSGPVLLVCDAQVHVEGPDGERSIPIAEWFVGPKENALNPGELVVGVSLPLPVGARGGCYIKLGRYKGEDLAQAGVAVLALPGHEYRVAFGAVAPTPVRGPAIEALLRGHEITDALVKEARSLVSEEIAPITDIRSTREYRQHMVEIMLTRALKAAAARLDGGGPPYGTRLI
jgi:CO/xanthine dehydrogenase FAD-binding subunit